MEGMEQVKAVAVTTKAAYASTGGLAILSYFSLDQWAFICAIILGVSTFSANMFFKIQEDRRGKRRLELEEKRNLHGMNNESEEVPSRDTDVV